MSKTSVITARIDADTLDLVDRIAAAQGRSRSWFAAEAVRRMAEEEAAFLAFVQAGIDSADRGELIPQEEVRSEEHTSELQSLMRISYAVFCLKKKKQKLKREDNTQREQRIHERVNSNIIHSTQSSV